MFPAIKLLNSLGFSGFFRIFETGGQDAFQKSPVHSMQNLERYNTATIYFFFLLFSCLLSGCDYLFPPLKSDKISVSEADRYISKHKGSPELVIIDLRPKPEFDKGHIENAINLDYNLTDFPAMIEKLDKGKRYIMYDTGDRNSLKTLELMRESKILSAHIIIGGIDEWKKQGLPLKQ